MKKRLIPVAVVLVVLALLGAVLYWYFFVSMARLPEGDRIDSVSSPYSDCTVNVYLVNGGATVDDAIRGSVVYENGKEKTIYWNYHESDAAVTWLDKDTVTINGVQLNIRTDVYDFRRS